MSLDAAKYAHQHQMLDGCLEGAGWDESVSLLRRYFREDGDELFTGRRFDRFGIAEADPHRITHADVLSLTFLSIRDRLPELALDLLENRATEISALLKVIPTDVPMHKADWDWYLPAGDVHQLWDLLRRCGGRNRWVCAHKLLARKRPHLLPVYDNQVRALLGLRDGIWRCLWMWFHGDPCRADKLAELRSVAGGIDDVSLLRCLDVILWMRTR